MKIEPQKTSGSPNFSILIPTWNNIEYLKLCVESIQKNSSHSHQIIVHVNDGSDGTLEWVTQKGIDHTWSKENIGICLALNLAGGLAKHEWIVYMNDDMYCCPSWDSILHERTRQIGHDALMLSSTLVEPIDTKNRCVIVADFGRDIHNFQEDDLLSYSEKHRKQDWLGSTWPPTLVHKRWWNAVGGYSTEFSPGMASDNDFSMKFWRAGCRIFLGMGSSLVYHFMCKSTKRIIKNDGRRQFLRKWDVPLPLFNRHYLHRGERVESITLPEPELHAGYRVLASVARWKAKFS